MDVTHASIQCARSMAGSTMSRGAGKTALWVLRLSANGEVSWQETFSAP